MEFIKNLFHKKHSNKKVFLASLVLFSITFILLGLIHNSWCFIHDDFGVIWHCKINSVYDFFKFFYENSIQTFVQPSNYNLSPQDFFSVYYRPMSHIFYALENFFFNFSPYPYFLVRIFFHSINTCLLYYFFYLIIPNQIVVFLAALAFAFHPTLATAPCIGVITAQDHTINLTFLLLSLLFLKKHLDEKKIYTLLLALFLFTGSLFCIEIALFFPIIVGLGTCFYIQKKYVSAKMGLTYALISLSYLILRLTLYPSYNLQAGIGSFLHHISPLSGLQNRFFDVINLCCSLAYIPWLGEGYTFIKAPILILFACSVFLLFVFSKNKKFLLFLMFSFIIMLWPAYFRNYSERYLYSALPFFLVFFIFTLNHVVPKIPLLIKKIFMGIVGIIVFTGGLFVINAIHTISKESPIVNNALKELVSDKEIHFKKLCFIGLPAKWFAYGIAQAIWMHGINKEYPIYYDNQTSITTNEKTIKLSVIPIESGFRLTILNTNKASFTRLSDINLHMGKKIIHKQIKENILDISYVLDKKWIDENPYFITWDYEKNLFAILGYLEQ
jgi:hypothetical protein